MTTIHCHRCDGVHDCLFEINDGIKKEAHIPRPRLIPKPSCPAITGLGNSCTGLVYMVRVKRGYYPIRCKRTRARLS